MTVIYSGIPSGRRTPERGVELNTAASAAGLIQVGAPSVLAIGQRTSSGTIAEAALKDIWSDVEGVTYFGQGSVLANLIKAQFRQHPGITLDAIALDDADAGVAATGEIQFTGTATKAGVCRVWVGNRYVDVVVEVDDTAADIVDALVATGAAAYGDMPVTWADNLDDLTVTAKNKGPCGNDIYLGYELFNVTGITVVVVDMASGLTHPDLDTALAVVEPQHYDIIVVGGFEDATELAKLSTHLDTLGGPLEMRGGFAVYATTGTIAAATTLADNLSTSFRFAPTVCRGLKTEPWELAGLYAGALAAETDLAMPLNNTELKGLDIPEAADRYTKLEVESMLWNGVGPIQLGAGNRMRITRTISTQTENDAGAPVDDVLDIQTLRVLEWLRKQIDAMFAAKFPRAKFTDEKLEVAQLELVALLRGAATIEYLHQVEENVGGVVVERNEFDETQMDTRVPAPVVPGLHKMYSRVDRLKSQPNAA